MTAQQDVNELLKKKLKEELFLFGQEVENEDDENNENLLNIRNKVNSLLVTGPFDQNKYDIC